MPDALTQRLVSFARALRRHGVVVGTSDLIDAGAAASALGFDDRSRLREGLAATLMRRAEQRGVFDELFDLYFPAAIGARVSLEHDHDTGPRSETTPGTSTDPTSDRERARELTEELARALAENDERALNALASTVVAEFGQLRRPGEQGFSARQAIEQFQPNLAVARAAELLQNGPESGGDGGGTGGGSGGRSHTSSAGGQNTGAQAGWQPEHQAFTQRFDRDDARERVAAFRRRIETEARDRKSVV